MTSNSYFRLPFIYTHTTQTCTCVHTHIHTHTHTLTLQALPYPKFNQVSSSSGSQRKVCVARYSFTAQTAEDMNFTKGEQLLVLNHEHDWWLARSLKTQKVGYIPSNYVNEAQIYEARYTHEALLDDDISFKKWERLLVLDKKDDRWFARSLKTQREGYIPSNHVTKAQSDEAEE